MENFPVICAFALRLERFSKKRGDLYVLYSIDVFMYESYICYHGT